jgi:hypothetical protein
MRRIAILSLAALALAGCQTIEERRAEIDRADDRRCQDFGARRGTPLYTQCRLDLDRNRALEAQARRPVVVGLGGPGVSIGWGIGGYCRNTPWGVRCY